MKKRTKWFVSLLSLLAFMFSCISFGFTAEANNASYDHLKQRSKQYANYYRRRYIFKKRIRKAFPDVGRKLFGRCI